MAYQEAIAGHSPINIVSDDIDVLLVLAHHHTVEVTMEAWFGSHTVVNGKGVVKKSQSIIPYILAAHALTDCDAVSSLV